MTNRTWCRWAAALCIFLAFGRLGWAAKGPGTERPLAALQGTWQMAQVTVDGQVIKDKDTAGGRITFKAGEMTFLPRHNQSIERMKVEVDPAAMPAAIHLERIVPADPPQNGWMIYEVAGDRLRLAFFDTLKGRPTSFEPQQDLIIFELRRATGLEAPTKQPAR